VAISGALYNEGVVEGLKGTGEELALYYYKGMYILSRNFVHQRNAVTKANREVSFLKGGFF
jgi:hypothetical protein